MTVELGILISIIGCFVGLAGWISGRDKRISKDSEWRGKVDTKLDTIHGDIKGMCGDIHEIKSTLADHETRICIIEEKTKK